MAEESGFKACVNYYWADELNFKTDDTVELPVKGAKEEAEALAAAIENAEFLPEDFGLVSFDQPMPSGLEWEDAGDDEEGAKEAEGGIEPDWEERWDWRAHAIRGVEIVPNTPGGLSAGGPDGVSFEEFAAVLMMQKKDPGLRGEGWKRPSAETVAACAAEAMEQLRSREDEAGTPAP